MLTPEQIAGIEKFQRYLDPDGDGIPYRTLPGISPKASYFTRGSGHSRFGAYTEDSAEYQDVLDRLTRKFATAAQHVPAAVVGRTRRGGRDREPRVLRRPGARGARRAAQVRGRDRLPARARLPVRRRGRGVPRGAPDDLRRRAESRCAAARAADAGDRAWTRRSCARSCTTTACRCRRPSSSTASTRRSTRESRHELHRQAESRESGPAAERARAQPPRLRRQHVDALRRLRPRLRHGRDRAGLLRARVAAAERRQALRHRLLVEDDRLLRRRRARLQCRARAHAVDRDRGQRGEPPPALHRRLGRRRLAVDRPRPARARDPAQPEHGLHPREQRRLRADQGPVLGIGRHRLEVEEGRGQRAAADRSGPARAGARRLVRRDAASPATRNSSFR